MTTAAQAEAAASAAEGFRVVAPAAAIRETALYILSISADKEVREAAEVIESIARHSADVRPLPLRLKVRNSQRGTRPVAAGAGGSGAAA